jgi:hypothetical protein
VKFPTSRAGIPGISRLGMTHVLAVWGHAMGNLGALLALRPHAMSNLGAALATVTVHSASRRGSLTDTAGLNEQISAYVSPHSLGDLGTALAAILVHAMAGAEPANSAPGTLRLLLELYVSRVPCFLGLEPGILPEAREAEHENAEGGKLGG